MNEAVAAQLLTLNQQFYSAMAAPFARSRATPAPGFARLQAHLPQPCQRFLDVGCGEGRLGRYLVTQAAIGSYTGVDFTAALLAQARAAVPGDFWQRDLSRPDCLDNLGEFDAIACLATLQHIPGRAHRFDLLHSMAAHLAPAGTLIISSWQFLDSARQRRKILPWSDVGLSAEQVEMNDYLLSWQRGGFGRRYVRLIDLAELKALAVAVGLECRHHFRADGREGDLNLYVVLNHVDCP